MKVHVNVADVSWCMC